jgi:hypothetical protein
MLVAGTPPVLIPGAAQRPRSRSKCRAEKDLELTDGAVVLFGSHITTVQPPDRPGCTETGKDATLAID